VISRASITGKIFFLSKIHAMFVNNPVVSSRKHRSKYSRCWKKQHGGWSSRNHRSKNSRNSFSL